MAKQQAKTKRKPRISVRSVFLWTELFRIARKLNEPDRFFVQWAARTVRAHAQDDAVDELDRLYALTDTRQQLG
jgi:hypothetical protein